MMAALLPPQVKLSRGRHRRHRRGRAQCRAAQNHRIKRGLLSLADGLICELIALMRRWFGGSDHRVGLSRQSGGMIEGRKGGGEVGGRTGNHFPRARGHDH